MFWQAAIDDEKSFLNWHPDSHALEECTNRMVFFIAVLAFYQDLTVLFADCTVLCLKLDLLCCSVHHRNTPVV